MFWSILGEGTLFFCLFFFCRRRPSLFYPALFSLQGVLLLLLWLLLLLHPQRPLCKTRKDKEW